jgi:hypothetical protein
VVIRKKPFVTFFGRTTGFIVNYTPDHAVRFDVDGNPVESLPQAYVPGTVEVVLGRGRKISAAELGKILGAS